MADFAFPQLAATTAASAIAAGRGARRTRGSKTPRSVFVSDVIGDERRGDAATRRLDRGRGTADSTAYHLRPRVRPHPGSSSAPRGVSVSDALLRRRAFAPSLSPAAERVEGGGGDGRRRSRGPTRDDVASRRCSPRAPRAALEPLSPHGDFRMAVSRRGDDVREASPPPPGGWRRVPPSAKTRAVAAGIPLEGAPVDASETLAATASFGLPLGLAPRRRGPSRPTNAKATRTPPSPR